MKKELKKKASEVHLLQMELENLYNEHKEVLEKLWMPDLEWNSQYKDQASFNFLKILEKLAWIKKTLARISENLPKEKKECKTLKTGKPKSTNSSVRKGKSPAS
jgi:hypothetical protein